VEVDVGYSDANQRGLLSLLAASQQGLDPTTAYGMFQDIQGDQDALNAQRQERQAGLIGMLQEVAMGGMPQAGAEALLDAAPGPMGPALQSAMSAMYPDGDIPEHSQLDAYTDETGHIQTQRISPEQLYGQSTSPAYVPAPPSMEEQQAVMEMEQQQQLQADLTGLQQDATAARAQEWTVDDFIARASQQNPELFAMAGEDVMAIIENTFGSMAVETRGMPGA
jgi:hypothetical protein